MVVNPIDLIYMLLKKLQIIEIADVPDVNVLILPRKNQNIKTNFVFQ